MDKNRVELRGTVSSDIETKVQQNNKKWCHFLLCTNEYVSNDNGERNIPTFINISVFNTNLVAYITKYARKGSRIEVEGKLTVTKREKNGHAVYFTNVLMTDVAVLKDKTDLEVPNPEDLDVKKVFK